MVKVFFYLDFVIRHVSFLIMLFIFAIFVFKQKNHKSQTTVVATPYIQISPEVPPAAGKKKKKLFYLLLFPPKYSQWTLVTEKKNVITQSWPA